MSSFSPISFVLRYDHPIGVIVLSVLGLAVWILGYRLVKVILKCFLLHNDSVLLFDP